MRKRAVILFFFLNPGRKTSQKTNHYFFILEHGQILSHWDRLPLELRQTIRWMADRQQAHDRLKHGWHSIYLHFEPCYICHRLLVINDQHHTLADFPLMHIWKPPHPHHILIHFPLGHQWQPPQSPQSPRPYHHYCMMDPPLS